VVERLSPRIRASHDSVTQRFSWVVSGLLVSRKCLKSLGRRAITNRLLYQLSYVGLNDLRGFCCISVSHFPGPSASTTTEKRNLTVDRGQVIQNNTSNLMS
jgi:hypothetical protein